MMKVLPFLRQNAIYHGWMNNEQPAHFAKPFSLRECLMLCLPALILGATLRIWFLAAIPEGSYGSDSPSYFQAVDRLWNEHRISFSHKRRWLYPILLTPVPALPFSPAHSIPVLQHLLGLATVFGVGWIVGNLTRLRAL